MRLREELRRGFSEDGGRSIEGVGLVLLSF